MMVGVVTYIYPNGLRFLSQFLEKLQFQDDQEFDLIIFNDGIENFKKEMLEIADKYNFNIQVYSLSGTILNVRVKSFNILKELNYNYYIFQDIDDLMSDNRVSITKKYLDEFDVVVNDLIIMGKEDEEGIWKDRMEEGSTFTYSNIRNYNIVGFGNTSIKKSVLERTEILESNLPIATDWFVFYQILKLGFTCIFTNKCFTVYRQHNDNIAGANHHITEDRLEYVSTVKLNHYKALEELDIDYFSTEIEKLGKIEMTKDIFINYYPFWWEETDIIKY